jgi:putative transposase
MPSLIKKQAALIMGRKIDVIRNNAHKYSVSAMCDVLDIPKGTYYYHADLTGKRTQKPKIKSFPKKLLVFLKKVVTTMRTRKIKKELAKLPEPKQVSRRRIGRLMNEMGLVSTYTVYGKLKMGLTQCW